MDWFVVDRPMEVAVHLWIEMIVARPSFAGAGHQYPVPTGAMTLLFRLRKSPVEQ
jgi:hypothetical protein